MARKLSEVTRRSLMVAAIAAVSLTTRSALAEEQATPAAAPAIIANPFSAGRTQSSVGPEHAALRRQQPTYRNPFADGSSAPPVESPLLPGPISRWQPNASPLAELSPIRSAILSAEPMQKARIPRDELPATETMRRLIVPPRRIAGDAASAGPPEPSQFTATPLAQPIWLLGNPPPLKPLAPIGQASFDQPLAPDRAALDASTGRQPAEPAGAAIDAIVISDLDDSPQNWLAQAQQAASAAESLHELTTVADLCQRGLAGTPDAEVASSLRRLAAWAHNRRGELLTEADQPRQAMQDFQRALALDKACSPAIHNRAVTLAEQNQLEAALRDFNRVIELNPGLAVAYRNRAELLAALDRVEQALPDYNRAIEALPEDAELYAARAYALQRLGELGRAGDDLDRALEIAPGHPEMLAQRGNLAADRGDYFRAKSDFQQAIAADPDCAEAHRSLAWLLATCPDERYRDAERALLAGRAAVELSPPDDWLVLDALAAAQAAAGQFAVAVQIEQQAIAAAPPDFAKPLRQRLALYKAGRPFYNTAR